MTNFTRVVDLVDDVLAAYHNELVDALTLNEYVAANPGGRLTLTSGTPVTTADVTGATTIYYTPHIHDRIMLWNGTSWQYYVFTETSLALGTLTSGLPYDVFAYLNAGVLALEKLAWTNGTTRATNISLQDGRYCKTGDKTRLYLGTFYTTSTTQTEDSRLKRFLWNMYNRAARPLHYTIGTQSWTYNTNVWRQANGDGNAKVQLCVGLVTDEIALKVVTSCTSSLATTYGSAAIGEDVTNAPHADCHYQGGGFGADGWYPFCSTLDAFPQSIGYHYYSWLEWANTTTITFYGGTGGNAFRGGLNGRFFA